MSVASQDESERRHIRQKVIDAPASRDLENQLPVSPQFSCDNVSRVQLLLILRFLRFVVTGIKQRLRSNPSNLVSSSRELGYEEDEADVFKMRPKEFLASLR
jgi:hypothetical protein